MQRATFIAGWIGAAIAAGMLTVAAVTIFEAENWAVLAGVATLEGAVLGALQSAVLRRRRPVAGWMLATLVGVVAGRSVQYVLETGPWMSAAYGWTHVLQLAAGAAAGALVGTVMAVPQAYVLGRSVRNTAPWFAARAGGTAAAFVFLGTMQMVIGYPNVSFGTIVAALLGIGAAAGAIGAAVEAPVMFALLSNAERPRPHRLVPFTTHWIRLS